MQHIPLETKSMLLLFIDDASIYCYVYLLHSKDETLNKFKIYKQEVELHKNELIKVLRIMIQFILNQLE